MRAIWLFCVLLIISATDCVFAAAVPDREGAVRKDKAILENDPRWIYNDYERGFAEARRTDKPLLVVLRCVPCLACAGIDAAVLLQETELGPLLDQFVCVRVIDANALDLKLFQVDYDLSFSTVFFNGDGTIYGRYGSWRHQRDPQDKTTTGYKRALEAALAIHRGYPGNKASLAGKQGRPIAFKRPVDIPELADRYKPQLDWEGNVVKSCIHCHQVGEALREDVRSKTKRLPPEMIYRWPAPETIGVDLAPDSIARVEAVSPGSAAAAAGLKSGDEIVSLDGQPLISIADVSWVLNGTPNAGKKLEASVRRGDKTVPATLTLAAGWREKADISRRAGTWDMRRMATGGMVLQDLSDEAREKRGLTREQMALAVTYVGEFGAHGAAKRAGFKKDDVIVEMGGGQTSRMSESEMIGYLLQKHGPDEHVQATVLRADQRLSLDLPIQ